MPDRSRAKRMLQHIERRLNVRVPVGIVRADLLPGQVLLGSQVQAIGNVVRFRVAREGKGTPAPCIKVEVSGLEPLSKRRTRRLSTCLSFLWFSRKPCRKAGEVSRSL